MKRLAVLIGVMMIFVAAQAKAVTHKDLVSNSYVLLSKTSLFYAGNLLFNIRKEVGTASFNKDKGIALVKQYNTIAKANMESVELIVKNKSAGVYNSELEKVYLAWQMLIKQGDLLSKYISFGLQHFLDDYDKARIETAEILGTILY